MKGFTRSQYINKYLLLFVLSFVATTIVILFYDIYILSFPLGILTIALFHLYGKMVGAFD